MSRAMSVGGELVHKSPISLVLHQVQRDPVVLAEGRQPPQAAFAPDVSAHSGDPNFMMSLSSSRPVESRNRSQDHAGDLEQREGRFRVRTTMAACGPRASASREKVSANLTAGYGTFCPACGRVAVSGGSRESRVPLSRWRLRRWVRSRRRRRSSLTPEVGRDDMNTRREAPARRRLGVHVLVVTLDLHDVSIPVPARDE